MPNSQLHIYSDGRIHVQTGVTHQYISFDLNPDDASRAALQCYFDCQVAKGNYSNSFADTSTKYVPVEVTETTKVVRVVRAISPATSIEVSAE